MSTRFDMIGIFVNDLQKMVAFYNEVLGFESLPLQLRMIERFRLGACTAPKSGHKKKDGTGEQTFQIQNI